MLMSRLQQMKRYSISRYELGKDKYVAMPKEIVQQLVDNDPSLFWYENVDDYYRERQKARKNPAIKISFVYNYQKPPEMPDIHATFMEGPDKLLIKVNNPNEDTFLKLKEMAENLNANLYET